MKKVLLLLGLVISALIFFSFISKSSNNEKVVICHIPPGNPENAHEIEVSVNTVEAHLAHGDNLGDCPCDNSDEPDLESR